MADVETAIGQVFSAIDRAEPENVRYASCKLADGVTFVAVLEVDEGTENPLPALPEFREPQELGRRAAQPGTADNHRVVQTLLTGLRAIGQCPADGSTPPDRPSRRAAGGAAERSVREFTK